MISKTHVLIYVKKYSPSQRQDLLTRRHVANAPCRGCPDRVRCNASPDRARGLRAQKRWRGNVECQFSTVALAGRASIDEASGPHRPTTPGNQPAFRARSVRDNSGSTYQASRRSFQARNSRPDIDRHSNNSESCKLLYCRKSTTDTRHMSAPGSDRQFHTRWSPGNRRPLNKGTHRPGHWCQASPVELSDPGDTRDRGRTHHPRYSSSPERM